MSSESVPKKRRFERRLSEEDKRVLSRAFVFPGAIQIVVLATVGFGALRALGYDTGNSAIAWLLVVVVGLMVALLHLTTPSWQQTIRPSLILAALGAAVWLLASVIRGPFT
jgi:hypothetical protein